MGISRDSVHKRRKTGGRRKRIRLPRKFESGRAGASCSLKSDKRIRTVRARGGNLKYRALRLNGGNFSWGSEGTTHKSRILDVVYNSTNNELVRTKTLVKNAIVQIDATPFRQWYEQHYGLEVILKTKTTEDAAAKKQRIKKTKRALEAQKTRQLDPVLLEQLRAGKFYACISSRPGQSGRADGYILEGTELAFYLKKIKKKGGK